MSQKISFQSLSSRAQIRHLAELASQAIAQYPVRVDQLKLYAFDFNATYRVNGPDGTFALRLNINSNSSESEVEAETEWVRHIHLETPVLVPQPVQSFSGRYCVPLNSPFMDQNIPCVLYEWLPGRSYEDLAPKTLRKLGASVRLLHDHGKSFTLSEGNTRQEYSGALLGKPNRLPRNHVFMEVERRLDLVLKKLSRQPKQLIHFDLHGGNFKVDRGRILIFDFDDCLFGWPILDLAQAVFYMRGRPDQIEAESAFWTGLGRNLDDYGVLQPEFETLLAGRSLLVANDVTSSKSAHLVAISERYQIVTERRLDHFLNTGRVDPGVCTLKDVE